MASEARRSGEQAEAGWSWFLMRGLLALALGVIAIFFPFSALSAFTMVFAAFAFVDGILSVATGMRRAGEGRRWWAPLLRGLLGMAVGIVFVVMPVLATVGYALATLVILSAWALLTGMLEISAAVRLRREIEGEWLLGLSGLLSILLGLVIPLALVTFPGATILSVAWIIGIYAAAAGIVLIIQAVRLKQRRASAAA
ncbi:MAG: DUF308 domain-containing protein [Pseudomonadota bacterium]|nr:DUF308 domain-containing protein [Pseudomonadota bacterium]